VHEAAVALREQLLSTLLQVNGHLKIYAFKERVKSARSLLDKVQRKRADGRADYNALRITDAWGCRYVTLFGDHIIELLDDLFVKLKHYCASADAIKLSLVETRIYMSDSGQTQASFGERIHSFLKENVNAIALGNSATVMCEPERKVGYSSIHLVFSGQQLMNFARSDSSSYSSPVPFTSYFEVQIRDVFEEAWSEAEHFVFYRHKDDRNSETPRSVKDAKAYTQTVRQSLDGLRSSVTEIRRIVEDSYKELTIQSSTERQSFSAFADNKAAIIEVLGKHGAGEFSKTVSDCYDLMEEASRLTETDAEAKFLAVSEKWELLRVNIPQRLTDLVVNRGNNHKKISYYLDIEQANSWYFTMRKELVEKALTLYSELHGEYPNDPTIRFRYARALRLGGSLKITGLDSLQKAADLVANFHNFLVNEEETVHRSRLGIEASILDGFIHYVMSQRSREVADRDNYIASLTGAIERNDRAIEYWKDLPNDKKREPSCLMAAQRAIANSIYYRAIFVDFFSTDERNETKKAYKEAISRDIALLQSLDSDSISSHWKTVDSLMHGCVVLGEAKKAVELATSNHNYFRDLARNRSARKLEVVEIADFLREDERGCYRDAMNVLLSMGGSWKVSI